MAIVPPVDIKKELTEIIAKIRIWNLPVKTVAKENLHLTLKFLDSRTDEELNLIQNKLEMILKSIRQFPLVLNKLKIFPSLFIPRVISVDTRYSHRLRKLEKEIRNSFANFKFIQKDNRCFKSHITLARIQGGLNRGDIKKLERISVRNEWQVDAVKIFESDLSGEVPKYAELKSYPLTNES